MIIMAAWTSLFTLLFLGLAVVIARLALIRQQAVLAVRAAAQAAIRTAIPLGSRPQVVLAEVRPVFARVLAENAASIGGLWGPPQIEDVTATGSEQPELRATVLFPIEVIPGQEWHTSLRVTTGAQLVSQVGQPPTP